MYNMIIEDTANRFYAVKDAGPDLAHVWIGIAVKKVKGGFAPKANAREQLVRRAGCHVVSKA